MSGANGGTLKEGIGASRFFILLAIFGGMGIFTPGWATEYPARPIDMIVCYGPGSGGDFGSRIMADRITKFLGQQLISVYKPGGGGSLGAAYAARAKPDGYTLLVGSTTPLAIAPVVKKMDYKLEDFILLGTYSKGLHWLAARPDRWKNLKEFVEEAKTKPGKIMAATFGKLSASDFCLQLLNKQAGIELVNVPFKSSAEEIAALLGGHVDVAFISSPGAHLESGTIRILAIAEKKRVDELPNIPAYLEYGYPIFIPGGYSFCFPQGTPQNIVNRFLEAQSKAVQQYGPEIKADLKKVEQFFDYRTPEETVKIFKELRETVTKIAEDLGVAVK